jgi:hypothetical protein
MAMRATRFVLSANRGNVGQQETLKVSFTHPYFTLASFHFRDLKV